MLALHISLESVEQACVVRVWNDTCKAYDMGDTAAQWFTDFLMQDRPAGMPATKLRLVRFDPEHKRLSDMKWTKGLEARNQFSDGYPLLVISEASVVELNTRLNAAGHASVGVERFRPNIVLAGLQSHDEDRTDQLQIDTSLGLVQLDLVKPCPRCPIPEIDPKTALSNPEVSTVLQTYRQDRRVNGAITFGMNAVVIGQTESQFELPLAIGQVIKGALRF